MPRPSTYILRYNAPISGQKAILAAPHRFSFNGQERTDEIAGTGNHTTALYWEYDTRLGRRWNVDPLAQEKPWMSSYHTFSNNPVIKIDPQGDREDDYYFDKNGKLVDYVATGTTDRYFFESSSGEVEHSFKSDEGNTTTSRFQQNMNPNFRIVNIYTGPGLPGHTALGTNGATVGFYPKPGQQINLFYSEMTYSDMKSDNLLKKYPNLNIFFLKVGLKHQIDLISFLNTLETRIDNNKGPKYVLPYENCTSIACKALKSAGIQFGDKKYSNNMKSDIPILRTPIGLNSFMQGQFTYNKYNPIIGWLDRGTVVAPGSSLGKYFIDKLHR